MSGNLGTAMSAAATYVNVTGVLPNTIQWALLNICLQSDDPVDDSIVEVFITTTPANPPRAHLVGKVTLAKGDHAEYQGRSASPGESVVVRSSTSTVAIRVDGSAKQVA